MKKIALLLITISLIIGCSNDDDNTVEPIVETQVSFAFSEYWDDTPIVNADYQTTTFTNAFGTDLTISKLVYLISDVTFTATDGTVYDAGDYFLIDARAGTNSTFTPDIEIPEGEYAISFTFGFDDEDNDKVGGYADLNSSDGTWSVPAPLGGGYHYMRLEGTFEDSSAATQTYQYHTIRANKHTSLPPGPGTLEELTDTSFSVNLGTYSIVEGTEIKVEMNVAEWFKNPNTWDLNVNSTVLMPKYDVQLDMNENGRDSVFSAGPVILP